MANLNKYVVILPRALPVDFPSEDLARVYGDVPRHGVTEASSERKALTNLVFRACHDRDKARIMVSYLLDRIDECEIYEVPEVFNESEDGSISPILDGRDRIRTQEIFLADAIARRRCISDSDAMPTARKMLRYAKGI